MLPTYLSMEFPLVIKQAAVTISFYLEVRGSWAEI
jgi:hypothetical protein